MKRVRFYGMMGLALTLRYIAIGLTVVPYFLTRTALRFSKLAGTHGNQESGRKTLAQLRGIRVRRREIKTLLADTRYKIAQGA